MGSSSESESEDDVQQENNKVESLSTSTDDSTLGFPKKSAFASEAGLLDHEQDNHQEPAAEEDESDEIRIAADFPPIRADLGRHVSVHCLMFIVRLHIKSILY